MTRDQFLYLDVVVLGMLDITLCVLIFVQSRVMHIMRQAIEQCIDMMDVHMAIIREDAGLPPTPPTTDESTPHKT